ncbi:hypothetical protein WKH56_06180 [Priestia sp. SB1]|uniref:Uncharacterized protein n=1 Tax=Priestia aryabhattai TaxID=412384 RepID=A0AAX6NC45_PRIAR|nr:hypothetical protein [Priestia aryabhattai]MDU9693432.1 hypothetical protein [Priestia aryabhattai]NGY88172.1 hypothetical protein [Priestia megaterium]
MRNNPIFNKSDIVVREVTKGIFKIEKSTLSFYKVDSYLDSNALALLLNTQNVLMLNNDDYVVHSNFRVSS